MLKVDLRVLITKEENIFNAICLEMGLATAGPDLETVKKDMVHLIDAHITACIDEGRQEDIFVPAPSEYWSALRQAIQQNICREEEQILPRPKKREARDLAAHFGIQNLLCGAACAAST